MFASSPKLIAGYYVLHRLLVPRHPPYTLIISSFSEPTNSQQNYYHVFDIIVYQDMCDIALTLFTCKCAKDQELVLVDRWSRSTNVSSSSSENKCHVLRASLEYMAEPGLYAALELGPHEGCTSQYFMVELWGLEPQASCLQSRRSSQLSYSPELLRSAANSG